MEPTPKTEIEAIFDTQPPILFKMTDIWRWTDSTDMGGLYTQYMSFIKANNYKVAQKDYRLILGGGSRGRSITEILLNPTITLIYLQSIGASLKFQKMFLNAYDTYLYKMIVKSGNQHSTLAKKVDDTEPQEYPNEDDILQALDGEKKDCRRKINKYENKIKELARTIKSSAPILDRSAVDALVGQMPNANMFIYKIHKVSKNNGVAVIRFSQYATPPELTLIDTIKYPDNPQFITYLTTELDKIKLPDPDDSDEQSICNQYKISPRAFEKWFINLFLAV